MAKIIKTTGEVINVEPRNKCDFKREELKEIVQGFIEIVWLADGKHIMVVNEEGHLLNLPINTIASQFYPGIIVGDVLFCERNQVR